MRGPLLGGPDSGHSGSEEGREDKARLGRESLSGSRGKCRMVSFA